MEILLGAFLDPGVFLFLASGKDRVREEWKIEKCAAWMEALSGPRAKAKLAVVPEEILLKQMDFR